MADQVTPATDKTPEDIEREMQETRTSLTDKVVALENQVVGTVQTAADTITGTVEAVKSLVSNAPEAVSDTMKQAVAAVSETVKGTFNVTGCIRRNPWSAVGVSTLAGCVIGWLFTGSRRSSLGAPEGYVPATAGAATQPRRSPAPEPVRSSEDQPGFFDELVGMVGGNVKEMVRTALETVSVAVKEQIQTGVPKLVDNATSRLTNTNGESELPSYAADFDARRSCA